MSKKILFVIAGPRLKGASAFAARTAAEGAGQGGADVEIVELPKLTHVQSMGCISCMRCVSMCPFSQRRVPKAMQLAASAALIKMCAGRKEPKFYL